MADVINLKKNDVICLTKDNPGLRSARISMGWGEGYDLDTTAFLLDAQGNLIESVYFGKLDFKHRGRVAVLHHGDDLVGGGVVGEDNEVIDVFMDLLPDNVHKVIFFINIYNAGNKHFGQVKNTFVSVQNPENDQEILRYNLAKEYAGFNALFAGELVKNGSEWDFTALGNGFNGSIGSAKRLFGKGCTPERSNYNATFSPTSSSDSSPRGFWGRIKDLFD